MLITEHNAFPSQESSTYVVEASDIGLAPGYCPHVLETTLGNKQPFVLETADEQVFRYRQSLGILKLKIYND